jgi:hypothetical protein
MDKLWVAGKAVLQIGCYTHTAVFQHENSARAANPADQ